MIVRQAITWLTKKTIYRPIVWRAASGRLTTSMILRQIIWWTTKIMNIWHYSCNNRLSWRRVTAMRVSELLAGGHNRCHRVVIFHDCQLLSTTRPTSSRYTILSVKSWPEELIGKRIHRNARLMIDPAVLNTHSTHFMQGCRPLF